MQRAQRAQRRQVVGAHRSVLRISLVEIRRERWRREIEPIATRILERAGLKRIDPELVAHLAHGNADYLARLMLEDPERFPRDRIVRFAAEAAGGIAALLSAGAAGR